MKKNANNKAGKQQLISSFFTKSLQVPSKLNDTNEITYDSEVEFIDRTPDLKKKVSNNEKKRKLISDDNQQVKKCKVINDKVGIETEENVFETPKKKYKPPTRTPRKPSPRSASRFKIKSPCSSKLRSPSSTPKKLSCKKIPNAKIFNTQLLENFIKSPNSREKTVNVGLDDWKITKKSASKTTPTKIDSNSPIKNKVKLKLEFQDNRNPLKEVTSEFTKWENINLSCKEEVLKESNADNQDYEDMFNDSWDDGFQVEEEYLLDLSNNNYCKILAIDSGAINGISLLLESVETKQKAKCLLKDFWISSIIKVGCKVYVEAKRFENEWLISKDFGILVLEPDYLVSCTTVTKSLYCKRQAIFQQYYSYEGGNKYMIIGVLVHQLLQKILKAKIKTVKGVQSVAKRLLTSKETMQMLYSCSEEIEFIKEQMEQYIPRVANFMDNYFCKTSRQKVQKGNWKGMIDSVEDIEENIWCKELGLKGKIDVTIKCKNRIVPLELKTGKSSMSLEHRTQMLLYYFMMNRIGYNVNTSLLLYLKDGIIKDFTYNTNVMKDVLLIRNELAYYLTRKVDFDDDNNVMKLQEMPEPLNNDRICSRCDYNVICASYSTYETHNVSDNYKAMSQQVLSHLETAHIDYFIHWISLIRLESTQSVNFKDSKQIYTVPALEREKNLQCISYMKIESVLEEENGYKHTFVKGITSDAAMQTLITEGSYVMVSTDKRPAVASGIVCHKESNSIDVLLERDLRGKFCTNEGADLFHVDTYESRNSDVFNMSNLALLLEPTDRALKLRKLIIEKTKPIFEDDLPKSSIGKCVDVLKDLNRNQKRAVLKAMMAKDYLLIKGMPGTGKTATIVSLIQCLIKLKKTVLITSHTHSSVDNVCVKLVDKGVNLLRLGSQRRLHKGLVNYSESLLTNNCKTVEELEKVYSSAQVVAVTCLGAKHIALSKRSFDYCIVDESTQVLQPAIIKGLFYADVFVLIGDPDQLEPVVRNPSAVQMGLGESLFERLCTPHSCVTLTDNYRMNKTLTACANALTYKGELAVAKEEIGLLTLQLPQTSEELTAIYEKEPWIKFALDDKLESSVRLIDTGPVWNRINVVDSDETRCTNTFENVVCRCLVDALLKGGLSSSKIGVISPYKAQVTKLSSTLKSYHVEVSTVDQFQGRDKQVIIFSCTRSNDTTKAKTNLKYEILENKKRLTVALTRAKVKFILIADLTTIKCYTPFAQLLDGIDKNNIIALNDTESGFNWNSV